MLKKKKKHPEGVDPNLPPPNYSTPISKSNLPPGSRLVDLLPDLDTAEEWDDFMGWLARQRHRLQDLGELVEVKIPPIPIPFGSEQHERHCPIEIINVVREIYERQIDRIIKLLSEKK